MDTATHSAPASDDDPLAEAIDAVPEALDALARLVRALERAKVEYRSIEGTDDYVRIERLHEGARNAHLGLCLSILTDEQVLPLAEKARRVFQPSDAECHTAEVV